MQKIGEYNKAFKEVYTILKFLNIEEYKKIPKDIIEVIETNRDLEYEFIYNEKAELQEQKILVETKAVLFNIFRDYLATEEQRKKIKKIQMEDRLKLEREKQELYNTNVFMNKSVELNNTSNQNEKLETNLQIIKHKENIFIKIIKYIKNLIKK